MLLEVRNKVELSVDQHVAEGSKSRDEVDVSEDGDFFRIDGSIKVRESVVVIAIMMVWVQARRRAGMNIEHIYHMIV